MMIDEIKKIAIISDTHMYLTQDAINAINGDYQSSQIYDQVAFNTNEFDDELINTINNRYSSHCADIIIHAGDIGAQQVIDILESYAPVVAVNGNCDFQTFRTLDGTTEDFRLIRYNNIPIYITHKPQDLPYIYENDMYGNSSFEDESDIPKLLIHGHTHKAEIIKENEESATICPGSSTMGRYGTPNSIAIVYVSDSKIILAQLVELI